MFVISVIYSLLQIFMKLADTEYNHEILEEFKTSQFWPTLAELHALEFYNKKKDHALNKRQINRVMRKTLQAFWEN